jgi:cytosine deaminase
MAAGVNVAFGHDCVMDPWYGVCCDYMLEVAHMGLHVAQMTSQKGIRQCFDAVTTNAAKMMHLEGCGLEPGCDASFVLQARDAVEAIRLRSNRLKVWRKGKLVAETAEVVARLHVTGRPNAVGFSHP